MMPTCNYRGCRRVAEVKIGEINTGEKDGYVNDWPVTVYVCKKCQKKILKKLGLRLDDEK